MMKLPPLMLTAPKLFAVKLASGVTAPTAPAVVIWPFVANLTLKLGAAYKGLAFSVPLKSILPPLPAPLPPVVSN